MKDSSKLKWQRNFIFLDSAFGKFPISGHILGCKALEPGVARG
jgi:hypothetical protein